MPDHDHPNGDSSKTDMQDNITSRATVWAKAFGLWWIVIGGCALAVVLLSISIYHPYLTERVKFFTANALSLVVLVAVAVQVKINQRQWEAMEKQLDAMNKQGRVMSETLAQNERAVAASEAQANVAQLSLQAAQEAFYIEQRAYVGIKQMRISNLGAGQYPTLTITWFNGGKTPAWRFRSIPYLVLGDKPTKKGGHSSFEDDFSDISVSFMPAGEERTVSYSVTDFKLTEEMVAAITGGGKNLYALAEWGYIDIKGTKQHTFIWALYDLPNQGFVELEGERQNYYPN